MFEENDKDEIESMFKNKDRMERIKEKSAEIFKIVIWILILVSLGYYIFFRDSKKSEVVNNVPSETEIKETALKNELIAKYDAIVFEDKKFTFSKDIQSSKDNNFLLKGVVTDISEKDGKTYVRFDSIFSSENYFGTFEINDEQERYIRSNISDEDYYTEFFTVVKIENVSRPVFNVDGEIDVDTVLINESSSQSFLLRGGVIDIKKN